MDYYFDGAPEVKFARLDERLVLSDGARIEGYASLFGQVDGAGDVVQAGAYAASLAELAAANRRVKMLWQHDPTQPIGIWDEVREDARGLYVKGRLLGDVARGREAMALIEAGAIDGLSIGYRTKRAERNGKGQRLLAELELWEVSLVTFPMLPQARLGQRHSKATDPQEANLLRDLADSLIAARQALAATRHATAERNEIIQEDL